MFFSICAYQMPFLKVSHMNRFHTYDSVHFYSFHYNFSLLVLYSFGSYSTRSMAFLPIFILSILTTRVNVMPQDSSTKPLMPEAAFYQRSKSPKYIWLALGEKIINLLNTDLESWAILVAVRKKRVEKHYVNTWFQSYRHDRQRSLTRQ